MTHDTSTTGDVGTAASAAEIERARIAVIAVAWREALAAWPCATAHAVGETDRRYVAARCRRLHAGDAGRVGG